MDVGGVQTGGLLANLTLLIGVSERLVGLPLHSPNPSIAGAH
jgi:hypothetical protein